MVSPSPSTHALPSCPHSNFFSVLYFTVEFNWLCFLKGKRSYWKNRLVAFLKTKSHLTQIYQSRDKTVGGCAICFVSFSYKQRTLHTRLETKNCTYS